MPQGYGGQDIGGTRSRDAIGGYGGARSGGSTSRSSGGIGGALQRANDWLEKNAPYTTKGLAAGSALGLPGMAIGGAVGGIADLVGGMGGMSMGGGVAPSVGGRGDRGRSGEGTIFGRTPTGGIPPLATALQRYSRPDEARAPGWMRFDNVMSPLQRRAYIATQGISGEQGLYRSQEAKDYYTNLLARTLIGPTGELGDFNQLLPIEQQYLQALGIPGWKDTAGLLGGLGIKPGMGMASGRVPRLPMPGLASTSGRSPSLMTPGNY